MPGKWRPAFYLRSYLQEEKKKSFRSRLALTPIQLNLQSLRQWPRCNYVFLPHPPWSRQRLAHLFYLLLWLQLIAPHHAPSVHLFIQHRFHENMHVHSLDQSGQALVRVGKSATSPPALSSLHYEEQPFKGHCQIVLRFAEDGEAFEFF